MFCSRHSTGLSDMHAAQIHSTVPNTTTRRSVLPSGVVSMYSRKGSMSFMPVGCLHDGHRQVSHMIVGWYGVVVSVVWLLCVPVLMVLRNRAEGVFFYNHNRIPGR